MKLSHKIGLKVALVAWGIAVCIWLLYGHWEAKSRKSEIKAQAFTITDLIVLTVREQLAENDIKSLNDQLMNFKARTELTYAVVYDSIGALVASTGGPAADRAVDLYHGHPQTQSREINLYSWEKADIYEVVAPFMVNESTRSVIQIGFDHDRIMAAKEHKHFLGLMILGLGFLMGLVSGWLASRFLGRPIEAVIEGAEQLVESNYEHRINIHRKDELGSLVTSFNQMAGTIRQDMVELESRNRQLLKAQERQLWLARVSEQVGEGVAVYDLEGMQTFVNHAWAAMHGYAPEQLLGQHISISHSHAQLERELIPFNQKVFEQGLNAGVVGHIKKDRTVFYAEMTTTLLKDADGIAFGFITVARDITDQKKAQDELIRERDLIKSIFTATPDAVIITDLNGNITEANEKAIEMSELGSRADFLGKNFSVFIAPEDRGLAAHNFQKTIDYGGVNNAQLNVVTAKGQVFPFEYSTSLLRSPEGRPTHIVSVGRNIALRKKAELGLVESEKRYRGLAEASPDMIFVVQPDSTVSYVNSFGANSLNMEAERIIGQSITKLFPGEIGQRQWANVQKVLSTGEKLFITEHQTPFKGQLVWLDTWLVPIRDQQGNVGSVMGISRDVTARKRAEMALQESNQRFELVLGATKTGFDVIDGDYNLIYIDPSWKKIYGELDGRKCHDYYMGRKDVCPNCGIAEALREKKTVITEEYLERENRWVEVHTIPFQNSDGQWLVAEFNIDINERRANEQKLKVSEQKYRELADTLPQVVFECDDQGRLTYLNKTGYQQSGYGSADLEKGLNITDLLVPEDRSRAHQNLVRRLKGGPPENQEFTALMKSGTTVPIIVYSNPLVKDDKIAGLRGVIVDISQQKKADKDLRDSELLSRAIMDKSPIGISVRDRFGKLERYNQIWQKIWAMTDEDVKKDLETERTSLAFDHKDGYLDEWAPKVERIYKEGGMLYIPDLRVSKPAFKGDRYISQYFYALTGKDGMVERVVVLTEDVTERKVMEEILQTSESQYRTTIDSIGDAIHVVDTELNILLANAVFKNWCLQLNLSTEPAGQNVFEVCPFLSPEVQEQYRQVIKSGQPLITRETNIVSGEKHCTETRKIPVTEGGRVTKVITVMRDITQEKEAERKLADTELRYQQVLEGVAEGIFRTTPEGKILLANQAIVEMLGYASMTELMNRDINTEGYPDPDHRSSFTDTMNREGQVKNWVSDWKKKDGSIITVMESAHVVRDDGGKIICYEGTVQNITDQLRSEQKLAESERKYHQIFEDIVEGIYRSTPEGKLMLANPALVRMLGFDKLEEALELDLNKSGYMSSATRKRFKELMERDGQVMGFETQWKRPDGKTMIISENSRAIRDDQGKVIYYEGTIEDITERQLAEEALLNEKNKLSDLFRVSLQVARAGDIQKKIDLTMEGIAGTELFARAVLVLKNGEGRNSHIAHFGMTNKEVQTIFNAEPTTAEKLGKIFDNKFRYSSSYFIPHDTQQVQFSVKLVSKKLPTNGDWHPDDVLLVPLMIKDKHIGYLTVDGPADGKIPNLETVRLLELFANQAAVAIENMQLYQDLERSYYSTLKAFVAAMDAKDPYTKGHSENVRLHALNIARLLKLPEEQVRLIDFSSLLHDIGKLAIRDEILTKPSLLSDHEYQEVKLHPVIGSHLVSEVESLLNVAPIIHSHHEHYDGSGYPQGIKGDKIPLESRIIAVADAFEAMTSDRPYRKAFDFHVAIKRLQEAAGTQFDNEIVSVFIKYHQKTHG